MLRISLAHPEWVLLDDPHVGLPGSVLPDGGRSYMSAPLRTEGLDTLDKKLWFVYFLTAHTRTEYLDPMFPFAEARMHAAESAPNLFLPGDLTGLLIVDRAFFTDMSSWLQAQPRKTPEDAVGALRAALACNAPFPSAWTLALVPHPVPAPGATVVARRAPEAVALLVLQATLNAIAQVTAWQREVNGGVPTAHLCSATDEYLH
jgi:hypothetical protein